MSGDGDLKFSKEALGLITKGLNGAIDELKAVGGSSTGSIQGSGFGELALSNMEAGHSGLAKDFEGFCEDWEWGVRALIMDANGLAARLGLAAGLVYSEEQYIEGTFKVAANAFVGNPHLSEDEITEREWGELVSLENYRPDYSAESFRQAGDEALQTWKDTGRTVLTEGAGGMRSDLMNDALGIDDQTFERGLDEAFGPSPEERAQQGGGGEG
ncbi:hypothetical protein CUT44_32060 [Streptomyces carminius]|uniref:Uncharacterized protein n=1 Tax=Streptomyces carminius TaxID=2665496 RepID=A0A2M8LPF9_9ACTN|nr:hypothetical protein [Streptomyces carminius]PJE93837.1 hypothetical protein CUT44_32060 [Streptomyces carminius]